jgi:hypothetical protein
MTFKLFKLKKFSKFKVTIFFTSFAVRRIYIYIWYMVTALVYDNARHSLLWCVIIVVRRSSCMIDALSWFVSLFFLLSLSLNLAN